jgi:hypothetical protein
MKHKHKDPSLLIYLVHLCNRLPVKLVLVLMAGGYLDVTQSVSQTVRFAQPAIDDFPKREIILDPLRRIVEQSNCLDRGGSALVRIGR